MNSNQLPTETRTYRLTLSRHGATISETRVAPDFYSTGLSRVARTILAVLEAEGATATITALDANQPDGIAYTVTYVYKQGVVYEQNSVGELVNGKLVGIYYQSEGR
jgi:hypothetical protein